MHYSNCHRFPRFFAGLLGSLLLSLTLATATFGANLLTFGVEQTADSLAITASGATVMRFRGGLVSPQTARRVASTLNQAALRGVRPAAVTVQKTPGGANLLISGEQVLEVTTRLAATANSTAQGLAQIWATNLQKTLTDPYLAVAAPDLLLVPLGEARYFPWGGTLTAQLQGVCTNPQIAAVTISSSPRRITVTGLQRGVTELVITGDGFEFRLPVEVKPWAATVATEVTGEVSAPPLPADDLRRVLRNAVLAQIRPMPGATVQLTEAIPAGKGYQLTVKASAPDCLEVATAVRVNLITIPSPRLQAPELVVSNYPERIREPATLLRDHLHYQRPLRVLWHHVSNYSQPLRFAVRVANAGTEAARVHVTESGSGPHFDEIFVGHQAMVRYLALSARGEGFVINIPPGRIADLYDVQLKQGEILSGIAQLSPLQDSRLIVEVVAEKTWPRDAYFPPVPEKTLRDPALTPYRFEAGKSGEVAHEVGGGWGFYHIGRGSSINLQGKELFGDYGVLYDLQATLGNPTNQTARGEIVVRAGGGVARGVFTLDGQTVETGLLQAGQEEVIARQTLSPGVRRTIRLQTIPQSGSNYPLTIILRSWPQP